MKKTIIFLIFTLSYSLSAQTWGNREYWISYEYTPKADQISEFEKAVKEKTNKWNTNLETAIFTFEVVNGPKSGTYERWVTRKDRSFFDQDFSKEIEYWKKEKDPIKRYIGKLIESGISEDQLKDIDTDIKDLIRKSVKQALDSPLSPITNLEEDSYA